MTIIITGARDWGSPEHWNIVRDRLKALTVEAVAQAAPGTQPHIRLVHGGATGVDYMADFVGKELGFEVVAVKADWNAYGRAAGPIRNRRMLGEYSPDFVLAFHHNINESKGTKDCYYEAMVRRIPAYLVVGPRPQ